MLEKVFKNSTVPLHSDIQWESSGCLCIELLFNWNLFIRTMQFLLRHPKHYSHSLAYPLLQFRSIWWPTTRFYSWLCNKLGIFCLAFNSEANDDDGDDGRSWFLLLYAPVPTNNCLKLFAIFQSVEHVNLWLFCIPIRLKYVFEGCTINNLVCLIFFLVFLFCYAFIILFRHWQQGANKFY